jgi:hypothetical protein
MCWNVLVLLTMLAAPAALNAVLVDRVAVAVGNEAITDSEIDREIRLTALENGEQPKFDLNTRREATQRLIEQKLIRKEIEFGGYPRVPDEAVEAALQALFKEHGGKAAVDRALAANHLTEDDLREHLRWQLELLKFIDLRFRPAVQVTPEDVDKYYQQHFSTQAAAQPPSEIRAKIEEKLTGERVDAQMERWLRSARRRTPIRYIEKELEPPEDSAPKAVPPAPQPAVKKPA